MASSSPGPIIKVSRCPVCKGPGDPHYRPFCSRRCANIDLARWLGGAYAIAGAGQDADTDGDDAEVSRRPTGHQAGPLPAPGRKDDDDENA